MALTRDNLKQIRAAIDAALATVKVDGISVSLGNCSFTPTAATFKLEVKTITDDGLVVGKEVEVFKVNCSSYGLEATDLFREVTLGGRAFIVAGLASGKKPFILKEKKTGKGFRCDAPSVIGRLKGTEAGIFFRDHGYPITWKNGGAPHIDIRDIRRAGQA